MKAWKKYLEEEDLTLLAVNNEGIIYQSREKGILPIYKLANSYRDEMEGGYIFDRVIGRGAALLASYLGLDYVYGRLMSKSAMEILERDGIEYDYLNSCENILNQKETDLCPVEKISIGIEEGEEALKAIKAFLGA